MRVAAAALILSAVALGVGVAALRREGEEPQRAPARTDRIEALEARVAELAREVESLKVPGPEEAARDAPDLPVALPQTEAGEAPRGGEALEAIVDSAVERKTERVLDEMRIKANKKPPMDLLASTLKLSTEQRISTERVVVEGQREVHSILSTPTHDGTNLMDQLVEVAARGIAEPGKDHGFGLWVARVLSEKVPGTDDTYGVRIESVKGAMRATFKREWSEAQYREFEAWGVDPTEIESVPGSPNEQLMKRITERARALGAALPRD